MTEAELLSIMDRFVSRKITATAFADLYQASWREWRDDGRSKANTPAPFDKAFTAADCYRPPAQQSRNRWSIDDIQLRQEISEALSELRLNSNQETA